jgi:hypothetical protein
MLNNFLIFNKKTGWKTGNEKINLYSRESVLTKRVRNNLF